MTAVDAPPMDTLVSQPRQEITFASRRDSLTLVHTPEYPVFGPQGQKTGVVTGGVRIQFQDGQLRVPLEGDVTTAQGKRIPAPELLDWLKQHRLNGDAHEGFFEVPQAAPPVSEDELNSILRLAMNYDADGLRALLESERAGWNRSTLVNSAEKALGQVEEFARQVAEQQEQNPPDEPRAAKSAPKRR